MRFLIPETFDSGGGHRSACNPSLRFVVEGGIFPAVIPAESLFPVGLNGFYEVFFTRYSNERF